MKIDIIYNRLNKSNLLDSNKINIKIKFNIYDFPELCINDKNIYVEWLKNNILYSI